MKTKQDVAELLSDIIGVNGEVVEHFYFSILPELRNELNFLREAGQKEYAGGDDNALGNFERLASQLNLDRKTVLWVYCAKHLDGITAYLRGHKSQREDVRGRINDVIVYLILLRAMVEDDRENE